MTLHNQQNAPSQLTNTGDFAARDETSTACLMASCGRGRTRGRRQRYEKFRCVYLAARRLAGFQCVNTGRSRFVTNSSP